MILGSNAGWGRGVGGERVVASGGLGEWGSGLIYKETNTCRKS